MSGYTKVANRKNMTEGSLVKVEVEGKPIVLTMVAGKIYAMDAICSHEGGPLEEGKLEGYDLTCPWHNAVFDVRTAKVSDQTAWATDLQSYPVKVDEATGEIMVSPRLMKATEASTPKKGTMSDEKTIKQPEFTLTLTGKERLEGTDIMTFRFTKQGYPDYEAGQFAFFPLEGVSNDSKGPTRHFTLSSSPTEDMIMISTRIRNTPYKQKLESLDKATKTRVSKPQGNFTLHKDHSKPAVFISGGIGVTPFRSMIKYATDKQLPLRITMFDSNRDEASVLYKDEFDRWAKLNNNLKIIYTITEEGQEKATRTDWKGERGKIGEGMLAKYLTKGDLDNSIFYLLCLRSTSDARRDAEATSGRDERIRR
jgi:ferredoxin-NADP reductase/nitrite reductase/ring-hydroxylating ferredoxin subunit